MESRDLIFGTYKAQVDKLVELQHENGPVAAVMKNISEDGTVLNVSAGTPVCEHKEDYKKNSLSESFKAARPFLEVVFLGIESCSPL
ncbi:hypothetical protein O9H85_34550 [Paenibacillus filicis]|uniref:Uncharacterized protein n=1 Tax=Paenibacillus gyeongsangnamensis TaxID=3388067 RepID=A0ABT4QKH8_9BACL|nr:hypothetical protein [Paenibacillus filicis]MCZ8517381.1 hypothetical protein [Paenibacillus filicis]